jgi:hypothetical protein
MKKHKVKRAWWQKPKNIRRVAMAALSSLVLVVGVLYFLVAGAGGGGPERVVLRPFRPAPSFSLPKTSGGDFRSSEYFGKGNVLLYFNEGMG